MTIKKNKLFGCLLLACTLAACHYDKADLVYPSDTIQCDTSMVKYSTTVLGILSANCYKCHSGSATDGGGIKLDVYGSLLPQVNNGQMLKALHHRPGASAMPKNAAKLASCDIAKIESWINSGAPNN